MRPANVRPVPPKPYVYQPYPRWVKGRIVQTAEEEAALLGEPVSPVAPVSDAEKPKKRRGK